MCDFGIDKVICAREYLRTSFVCTTKERKQCWSTAFTAMKCMPFVLMFIFQLRLNERKRRDITRSIRNMRLCIAYDTASLSTPDLPDFYNFQTAPKAKTATTTDGIATTSISHWNYCHNIGDVTSCLSLISHLMHNGYASNPTTTATTFCCHHRRSRRRLFYTICHAHFSTRKTDANRMT